VHLPLTSSHCQAPHQQYATRHNPLHVAPASQGGPCCSVHHTQAACLLLLSVIPCLPACPWALRGRLWRVAQQGRLLQPQRGLPPGLRGRGACQGAVLGGGHVLPRAPVQGHAHAVCSRLVHAGGHSPRVCAAASRVRPPAQGSGGGAGVGLVCQSVRVCMPARARPARPPRSFAAVAVCADQRTAAKLRARHSKRTHLPAGICRLWRSVMGDRGRLLRARWRIHGGLLGTGVWVGAVGKGTPPRHGACSRSVRAER
jgi:hypothetical protein